MIARALCGDRYLTGTATGGSATTLIDTVHAASIYPDDYFNNWELRNVTKDTTYRVTDWTKSSGTFTFATGTAAATSDDYEVNNPAAWMNAHYNDAIDMAIEKAAHQMAITDKVDYSLAYQRTRSLYPVPSGFSYISQILGDNRPTYLAKNDPANFDTLYSFKDVAGTTFLAQSFKVSAENPSFILGDVYLLLAKVGTLAVNLTLTIETNTSSAPTGTSGSVASSATVATGTAVLAEPGFVRFTFSAKPVLTSDTTYWLVLKSDTAANSTNYIVWANDTDANYLDGSILKGDATPTWTAVTGDLIFQVRSSQQNEWIEIRPRVDFEILRDTTRYIRLRPSGHARLRDGAALLVVGQGAPLVPTADSTSLDVPFDFVVAEACLQLIAQNPAWWSKQPGFQTMPAFWREKIDRIQPLLATIVRPGSIQVEIL